MNECQGEPPSDDDHGLVLAAHGSHEDPESSDPVFAHVDRLRDHPALDEVRAAFWQGEPHLREVVRTLASDRVTVVPFTMAGGYFADDVFPRELRLGSEGSLATSKTVRYTPPVGTHPALGDVIDRLATSGAGEAASGLAVVGHGTPRHDESGTSTREHVARLRARDRFSEVEAFFLDQEPSVETLTSSMHTRDIVVVPLFVANGSHTTEDIPRAIGLPPNPTGVTKVDGKRLWYTRAIGTEPALVEVIIDRATAECAKITAHGPDESPAAATKSATEAFAHWLDDVVEGTIGHRAWGELRITVRTGADSPRYSVRHNRDAGRPPETLDILEDVPAVRDHIRYDDDGQYRPLSGARTLPTGWIAQLRSREELVRVIETVYPASIYNWYRERDGRLDVTMYDAAVARQSGRFAKLEAVSAAGIHRSIEACCDNCVRRPAWTTGEAKDTDDVIPCREPCSFLLDTMVEVQEREPTDLDPSISLGMGDTPG